MDLGDSLRVYALSLPVMVLLDGLWLGVVARGFYRRRLHAVLRPDVRLAPAAAFYLLYLAAVVVLAIAPAVGDGAPLRALWNGALLGLAAYAAYDLVNLATLRDFPPTVAVVDMLWGTAVTAVTALWGYAAHGWILT